MCTKQVKIVFSFLICITTTFVSAQTKKIDSLRTQFVQTVDVQQQEKIAMNMCEQYYSLSADSLLRYVNLGISISNPNSIAYYRFKNFYCFYFLKLGKAAETVIYTDSLLRHIPIVKNNESLRLEIRCNKSIALIRDNQYKEAIETVLEFLEGSEKIKDTLFVLRAYTILGWANMELENTQEAVNWLNKGLHYTNNINLLSNASSLHNNIASCYENVQKYDSAIYYINQGLKYSTEVENLGNQANALNIRADIYSKVNKMKEAQKDLEDALEIRQKIGDLPYIIADMGQLSRFYATTNQTNKGIAVALVGIDLAKKSSNLSKLIYLNQALAKNYKAANRINDYAEILKNIIFLKDSLHNKNSEGAIAEMVTKYELQKKENIIIQQDNKLIRNRYISIGSAIAVILASLIFWLIYRNYSHIQQRKMEQALAAEKISSIKAVQQAEEKERKRIAADLHDNLGSYAAAITSNIRYLKEEPLKDNEFIISQLDENAQGIVTQLSDSIWVLKNEQLPITKLADRFKAWTQRIIQNYPTVKYFYEEDITNDIELTPGKILNIFLILKECLNNSLKHSNCTEIRIYFVSNEKLHLRIEDNGKGFQSNMLNRGNGVENIKYRAKECDLHVSWQSLTPSGTRVVISGD